MDDAKVSDLSNWRDGVSIHRGEKDLGRPFRPGVEMRD